MRLNEELRHEGGAPSSTAPGGLAISLGQHSDAGRKAANQDFHGAVVAEGSVLSLKGVAVAVADGISTSPVGHLASQIAVNSFLTDYYATSDTWTVERAAQRVIGATNAWLHAESRRGGMDDPDRGYVCTFAGLVLKARTAHLFHAGDSRIYRLAGQSLEPLTGDHQIVISGRSYLGRAMGMAAEVALDYRPVSLSEGDVFVLTTDGVHEHLPSRAIAALIEESRDDLDTACRRIVDAALEHGSPDNLTVQVVRIDRLPEAGAADFVDQAHALPPPPMIEAPADFDGYRLLRQIHANSRSRIYLARDLHSGAVVALKMPAVDVRSDPKLLRQFVMEEWIAARVASPHLLKAAPPARARNFLYVVTEHIEGVSLRQWMYDHPKSGLEAVRGIVEQLIKGARALHRGEIVHADLRPENVMIDADGVVKIIDFGSARVEGLIQANAPDERMLGAQQYSAPECLLGDPPTWRSDLFSIGVIAYEMLTGQLPYGAQAGRVRSWADTGRLRYISARHVPDWIDGALRTALSPNPSRRHEALSEFVTDLRTPNSRFVRTGLVPLADRDPVRFWQGVSLALACLLLATLIRLFS
jgi:serine/threonine protein phosphatase PrpC